MTVLGVSVDSGEVVRLESAARARGVYVIGSTITGKTTLLQSIAYQDMKAGQGLCVLDPHGDMIDWLLKRVPAERVDDVILFDPADVEYPFGLNLLECDRDDSSQISWIISTIVVTLRRLFSYSWGPLLEHVLGHTLWTAMAIPDSTLIEVLLLLTDSDFRKEKITELDDPLLRNFWRDLPHGFKQRLELLGSTINKLIPFLLDRYMRNVVGQAKSTFNLRSVMDNKQILLVNLSKGDLGENNSSLLGSVLISLILIAAVSRRDVPPDARVPFHVIVDEYQNFASESFAVLQSEARKFAIDLIVAHQFRDQLDRESHGSALNVGNFISFRVTGVDGPELAMQFDNTPPPPEMVWEAERIPSKQFPGKFIRGKRDTMVPGPQRLYSDVMMQTANELANLPPFQARSRLIERDEDQKRLMLAEYTLKTLDPSDPRYQDDYFGVVNQDTVQRIRSQSRALARSREEVEAEITLRTGGAADRPRPVLTAQRISDS